MRYCLLALFLLFLAPKSFALLSPLNQSLEEIQAILQNQKLQAYLPQSQDVLSIRKVARGYVLTTKEWEVLVEIEFKPSQYTGRQQFTLIFNEPKKLIP